MCALAARWWERTANSSCSLRVTPKRDASRSLFTPDSAHDRQGHNPTHQSQTLRRRQSEVPAVHSHNGESSRAQSRLRQRTISAASEAATFPLRHVPSSSANPTTAHERQQWHRSRYLLWPMTSPVENSAMAGASGARSFRDRPFRNLGTSFKPLNLLAAISFCRIFLENRMGTSLLNSTQRADPRTQRASQAARHRRQRESRAQLHRHRRKPDGFNCPHRSDWTLHYLYAHRLRAAGNDDVGVAGLDLHHTSGDGDVGRDARQRHGVGRHGIGNAGRQCALSCNVARANCRAWARKPNVQPECAR